MPDRTDQTWNSHELLQHVQAGDGRAATEIFDRYVRRLLTLARARISPKLARRIDPEDVVQSAYRSFFVHAENEEYALSRSGDLWRLLASITLHKLYRHAETHTAARRNIRREDAVDSFVARAAAAPDPSPAEVIAIVEQLQLVCKRLADAERQVLTARFQGQSIEQIAVAIQKSPRTVRRLLAQSRRKIEEQLMSRDHAANRLATRVSNNAADPRAGLLYTDFTLERLVGAGGMGKVYRATQLSTGNIVAIKALLKSRQANRNAVEKFLQEAEILAKLHHPNIVGVRGVGRFPGGGHFIAMDFVEGTDLQSRITQRPFAAAEAVRIVRLVTSAIAYAHEQGIVHGDLKPANVLVDDTDRVVVTDFGLAQFINNRAEPTRPRWLVGGTAGYMAPEVRDCRVAPTPASDIYGLGALLWALTTGAAPDRDGAERQRQMIPTPIATICNKCLRENPIDRFLSAGDLLEQLDAIHALRCDC